MAEPVMEQAEGRVTLTVKAANQIRRGQLIGYSSGWVLADADTAANIYAQYIALDGGLGGAVIAAARCATIRDADAPYTANTPQYLSGTAGGHTETRPATDNDVIQVIGRSLDTERCRIEIKAPVEWELFISPDNLDTSSEPGLGTSNVGWPGPSLTGTETIYFKGHLPSGLVGTITKAQIILDSLDAQAGDIDITVVGAHIGAAEAEDTGTAITAKDWTQADTDAIILSVDISAAFDTGFYKPHQFFAVYVDPDGLTNGALAIGLYLRGWRLP